MALMNETLSPAHLKMDPEMQMLMARPFDFTRQMPRTDLPELFTNADYLNVGSVVNTLYKVFNVPTRHYRVTERLGPMAPTLDSLLA